MKRLALLLLVMGCGKSLDELEPFPCGLDGSCPYSFVCDNERMCDQQRNCVQQQDCAGYGRDSRCAPVRVPTATWSSYCVPEGTAQADQGCGFSTDEYHVDECTAGTACFHVPGQGDQVGICRPYCSSYVACATGDCAATSVVDFGNCTRQCSPFDGGASCSLYGLTCGAVLKLNSSEYTLDCIDAGPRTAGQSCSETSRCIAQDHCIDGICRVACDTTHPCTSGSCVGTGAAHWCQ